MNPCFQLTMILGMGWLASGPPGSSNGLHYAPELPGCKEGIQIALDDYYSHRSASISNPPEMADRSKLDIQPPIAWYKLDAQDVMAGKGLEAAKLDRYWYFIKASNVYAGVISLSAEHDGTFSKSGAEVLSYMDRAVIEADGLPHQIAQVAALNQVQHASFEFRLLNLPPYAPNPVDGISAPPLYCTVIWLKSDVPGGDLIFALPQDPRTKISSGLQAGKIYTVAEMLKAISPAVKMFQASLAKTQK